MMKYELLYLLKSKRLLALMLSLLILSGVAVYFMPQENQATTDDFTKEISSLLALSEKRLDAANINGEGGFSSEYYKELSEIYNALLSADLSTAENGVTGWGEFLSCGCVFLFLLICCVSFCVSMFGREKRHGTFATLYASKRGRGSFVFTKALSGLFVCFTLATLFSLAGLSGAFLKHGLSGGAEYVQSLMTFVYCPFPLKVWQMAVIGTLLSALVAFAVSLLAGITVYVTESKLFSYALITLFAVMSYFIDRAEYLNSNAFFKNCNMFSAVMLKSSLGQYRCLNIFGHPFYVLYANLIISLLAVIFLFTAFLLLHNKRISMKIKLPQINKSEKRQKHQSPRAHSLYGFELLKVFSSRLTVILLVALTLFRIGSCVYNIYNGVPYSELLYAEYCRMWNGKATQAKSDQIRAEAKRISDAYINYSGYMESVAMHTQYTGDADIIIADYEYAQSHETALKRFEERYAYAQATDGKIFYESGWLSLMNSGVDPVLCVAVLYLCLFLTAYEHNYHTAATVYRSKYGYKRVYASKLLSLLTVCVTLTFLFELCRALPAVVNYGLPDGNYKLTYLSEYEIYPHFLSLSLYTVIVYTIKTLIVAVLCALSAAAERFFVKRGLK